MKISLIITTYNWVEALELTLKSVENQTVLPDEIIIADDGSGNDTKEFINDYKKCFKIPINHVWQEDRGFRAALIRNKAIYKSTGDYIIGIDGDMILHPLFIENHIKFAKEGRYIQGGRVLLTKNKTNKILKEKRIDIRWYENGIKNRKNAIYSNLLAKIFSYTSKQWENIRSCNFSLYKYDIKRVNGFNNNFTKWGREDSEFVVRLINSGVEVFHLKFNAIAYHLYHKENKKDLTENDTILLHTIKNNLNYCNNGLKESLYID